MSRESRPQNACDFLPPPRPWLLAASGKGPKAFCWLLLRDPVPSSSPLNRALGLRYIKVLRQFVYADGQASMLVLGHPEEVASVARLHAAGSFHPSVVVGVWVGIFPLPAAILAKEPMGGERHIQIVGLDPDASPKDELLVEVSHHAQINLSVVRREAVALGVLFLVAGKGRPEAAEGLVEMHNHKLLPSPERSNVVLSVLSDDVGNPPSSSRNRDSLILDFVDSRAAQLSMFYSGVLGVLPADHAIRGDNLPPESGSSVNARVEISMPRRPQMVRDRLENHARNLGSKLNMKAGVSWQIEGVLVVRPDLC